METICGIYLIENKINNHKYVGQSKDIFKRWKRHISSSKNIKDREYEKPLYRAFRKYGVENFNFSIIEICAEDMLNSKETFWIHELNTLIENNQGYNIKSGGQEVSMIGEKHFNHKLSEQDIIDIRTRYNNHERKKIVYEDYQNRIGFSGFSKIWKGETWKHIMPEIYTKENVNFHKNNTGQSGAENGRSIVDEKDVINIRTRKQSGESRQQVFNDYKQFGLSQSGFDSIWYNLTWKNIVVK